MAFELDEKGIPRRGYDIVDSNGKHIGKVTSGTMSPSLKKGIGLGYVAPEFSLILEVKYIFKFEKMPFLPLL